MTYSQCPAMITLQQPTWKAPATSVNDGGEEVCISFKARNQCMLTIFQAF